MSTNSIVIETGKYYRTRNNYKVRILTTERRHSYPAVGLLDCRGVDELHSWSLEGRWFSSTTENDLDLIKEWYDPPVVDWSAMPAWARWVAQDADGNWRWFACWPNRKHLPVLMDYLYSNIPPSYAPVYSGPWEDSLVERPAESESD